MTTTATLAERFDGVQELPVDALAPATDNPRTTIAAIDALESAAS